MKTIIGILITFMLLNVFTATITQEKILTWNYPIKPGTEEWKKFNSHDDMVEACRIPETICNSISTAELTELCMQYPLLYNAFAFNNLNDGLDKPYGDFNGIRELFGRKDAVHELLQRYNKKIDNLSFLRRPYADRDKGSFIISISLLEPILCRNELQNLVSGYEKKAMYAGPMQLCVL